MIGPNERVAYVVKVYPRFSETFVVTEIIARERRGTRIGVFALRPTTDSRFHAELALVAAPVTHLRRPTSRHALWQELRDAAAAGADIDGAATALLAADVDDAVQAAQLATELIAGRYTRIHAHFGSAAARVARLASRLTGLPYSFTAHAKDIYHDDVDLTLLATLIEDADHVVTVSEHNVRTLRALAPASATPIHRVYNGIDLDRFAVRARPAAERTGPMRLLAVGRLVPKKGFDVLVDAASRLRDAGTAVDVTIVGDGEERDALARRIDAAGLGDRVRLVGALTQEQVREALRDADAFVAPCVPAADGNVDGLPTVLLEAMAIGVPCVSTPVTGIPEAIEHGVSGLLVAPGDPQALAAAIAESAADPAAAGERADAARAVIETRFAADRQAGALDALAESAAAAAAGGVR